MNRNWRKRLISSALAFVMVLGYVPVTSMAAERDGLCEHHTQHTEGCGYSAAVDGSACNHAHTDACYETVTACVHVHGDCGYVAAVEGHGCDCQPDDSGEIVHTEGCGYVEPKEEVPCGHSCSVETGCVKQVPNCQHQHDAECGYVEPKEEVPCTFACAECAQEAAEKESSEKEAADQAAADAVAAQIEALPSPEEIQAMSLEEQSAVYNQVQSAYDAYDALTGEQKALVPNAEGTFEPLFAYFNSLTASADEGISGTCGEKLTWVLTDDGILTISGSGAMSDYDSGNVAPWQNYQESITSVTIESGVTSIGNSAFESCESLSSITIPKSVTSIGSYAFSYCSSLSSITIPEGVDSIGYSAFRSCESLSSITIPKSVTSIGSYAFWSCKSLSSITIPEDVTSIGNYAFTYCDVLTGIWVDPANTVYSSDAAGCLFDYDKSTLIQAPGKLSGAYTVPDGVSTIGKNALSGSEVARIVLPSTLVSVAENVFDRYTLKTIVFNGDVPTIVGSGGNPSIFYKSYDETDSISVLYPASNASWTAEAKQGLNPEGANILWIPFDKEAELSGSCGEQLQWCVEEATQTLFISGTGAMDDWDWETSFAPWIYYGGSIKTVEIDAGVTAISDAAFRNTAVEIIRFRGNPPSSIGKDVLESYDLTVYYPSGNAEWETVKKQYPLVAWIPEGSAFGGLHDIYLNHENMSDEEIRTAVQTLNQEELLKSLQSGEATSEFSYLENRIRTSDPELVVTSDVPKLVHCMSSPLYWSMIGASFNNLIDSENQVTLTLAKPNNAIAIPEGYNEEKAIPFSLSLSNIQNPEHLVVPISIKLYLLESMNPLLVDVFRRNSDTGIIEKIPTDSYWTKLGMVFTFAVTGTGDYLIVPKIDASVSGTCGDNLTWTYSEDKTLTISGSGSMYDYGRTSNPAPWAYYRENVEHIVIGENVTNIGSYAFYDCRFTNFITIPASVQEIGSGAFYGFFDLSLVFEGDCPNIQSDTLETVKVRLYYRPENVGWNAVADQSDWGGADRLTWKQITTSGSCGENQTWSFDEDTGILTIRGTGEMDNYVDSDLELLYSPWTPYSEKIREIVLEEGVTTIGVYAFAGCMNLNNVTIPNTVTSIGGDAFYNCISLSSITIPESVTSIDYNAFYNCTSLKEITFTGNAPTFGRYSFYNVEATAYYPANNSTWTSDVMQNYGGTITWKEVCSEHVWGKWSTTVEPTCTGKGEQTRICSICEEKETGELNALDHSYGDPTWTWNDDHSAAATFTCARDESHMQTVTAEVTDEVTTAATCVTEGERTYTATVTFNNKTHTDTSKETISALGHDWEITKMLRKSSCTRDGKAIYTCTRCSETKKDVVEAPGHDWDEGRVVRTATCTRDGKTVYTCRSCRRTRTEYQSALGHTWDDGVVGREATCTKKGTIVYTCDTCGKTMTQSIPALGHSYVDGFCTNCGHMEPSMPSWITIWWPQWLPKWWG